MKRQPRALQNKQKRRRIDVIPTSSVENTTTNSDFFLISGQDVFVTNAHENKSDNDEDQKKQRERKKRIGAKQENKTTKQSARDRKMHKKKNQKNVDSAKEKGLESDSAFVFNVPQNEATELDILGLGLPCQQVLRESDTAPKKQIQVCQENDLRALVEKNFFAEYLQKKHGRGNVPTDAKFPISTTTNSDATTSAPAMITNQQIEQKAMPIETANILESEIIVATAVPIEVVNHLAASTPPGFTNTLTGITYTPDAVLMETVLILNPKGTLLEDHRPQNVIEQHLQRQKQRQRRLMIQHQRQLQQQQEEQERQQQQQQLQIEQQKQLELEQPLEQSKLQQQQQKPPQKKQLEQKKQKKHKEQPKQQMQQQRKRQQRQQEAQEQQLQEPSPIQRKQMRKLMGGKV